MTRFQGFSDDELSEIWWGLTTDDAVPYLGRPGSVIDVLQKEITREARSRGLDDADMYKLYTETD